MIVSWIERKTNVWVLEYTKPERTGESRVAQAALRYFGCLEVVLAYGTTSWCWLSEIVFEVSLNYTRVAVG